MRLYCKSLLVFLYNKRNLNPHKRFWFSLRGQRWILAFGKSVVSKDERRKE